MDKGLMNDATSTDDSPTSGYQLSEIARATKSSYQANTQIQQYLVERLSKPNHNTKFKTLMIIKHVCRSGRPEFKREMGSRVDAIRECLQFKGPPDPLRGDEIYRRVRECAKEVLEALFDGQMPVTTSAVAAAGRVQGIGSDYVPSDSNSGKSGSTSGYLSTLVSDIRSSVLGDGTDAQYAGHPGATSSFSGPNSGSAGAFSGNNYSNNNTGSSGGSSGGFGNPNFQDPRNEKSWLQKASQLASSAASALPTFSKSGTNEPLQGGGSGFSGNNTHSSGTFNRAAFSNPGSDSGYSYATNRGPSGIHSNNSPYAPGAAPAWNQQQQFQQHQQQPSGGIVPDMPPSTNGLGRAGGAMSTGEYEKSIIDSLCEPGGLRPVPPEDKMLELLNSASTLSEEIVGNCLLDVLNDEAWQSRTKALIVISRLVKLPDCPAHQRWWAERADIVESLQSDPKAGVRTQAVKTLKAIDPSAAVSASATASASAPKRALPSRAWAAGAVDGAVEDESAQIDTSAEQVQQYAQPVAAPAPAPEVLDLLDMGDLTPPTPPAAYNPPVAAYAPSSVPSVISVSSGALSPLSQDDGSDFFGPGMTISNSSTPHVHSAQPAAPYGGVAMQSADAGSDADSMFAGMSVGSAAPAPYAPAPVVAPVAAPAPATNGFDFLNAGISGPPAASHNTEVDLFGSLTIADHSAPAPASAPSSSAPVMGNSKVYQDDFAGLLDMSFPSNLPAHNSQFGVAPAPVPVAVSNVPQGGLVPAANGLPAMSPEQHQQFLQYQQFLLHQQQQQQQQHQPLVAAPLAAPGAPNNIGLYLTRPVPGPGPQAHPGYGVPPGQPAHGYNYPPRGAVLGVGGQPRGPPPMTGSPQPAIQLRQGASVIAPGMLSHTAERKNIPVADSPGNSGFGFMGGQGAKPAGGNDSFSFVSDAMRSQK